MTVRRNYIDMVKKHWPGISTSDAECLLWETTCFGIGSAKQVEEQVMESYASTGGSIQQALNEAYAKLDYAMEQHKILQVLKGAV